MSKSRDDQMPGSLRLAALLAAVVIIWAASGYFLHSVDDRGEFGDMFGAVNALFSGLAFATLIYTVYLQRVELRMQRKELELTRSELSGQKLQMIAQNDQMRIDGFENSFFQVLRVFSDITNSIDLVKTRDGGRVVGRDCFRIFCGEFRKSYGVVKSGSPSANDKETIRAAYSVFYDRYQGDVGHYFRTLYNLVKLVDKSAVEDKSFYTNLIRAQLSSDELLLLFYNCQTALGDEKFKPLVEKYALLKTVPLPQLISQTHRGLYKESAYGVPYRV